MSLRSINLNLIPILQALLRLQNISRAAESLNLSQPTVSTALSRLRTLLGDPLMIQVGRKMELTPRARQLIGPVEQACAALQGVLNSVAFEPAAAVRCFSIACADHIPALIGPELIDRLAREAPHVTLHFINNSPDVGARHRLGEVDLMIVPRTVAETFGYAEIRLAHLFFERFVKIVGPRHPLAAQATASDADCARYPHVIFSPAVAIPEGFGDSYGMSVSGSGDHGHALHVRARFEHFSSLPVMAALSDAVAIMPRRLAILMQPFLGLCEVGSALPPIDLCVAWSPLLESDPAHAWFRALLIETVGDAAARPG